MLDKIYVVLAVFLFLYTVRPAKAVDPRVQPYANAFLKQVEFRCRYHQYYHPGRMSITLDDLSYMDDSHSVVGYCQKNLNQYIVKLDKPFWDDSSVEMRYELVAHELTHCMFDEGHREDKHHYMYPSIRRLPFTELVRQIDDFLKEHCQ